MNRWFVVARSAEVAVREVGHTQLLGQEIALWRDDTGCINAWENRCPHRGVRLSIGINTGMELRCQYHGWRYRSGSGQCTFIPAHPAQKPASTIGATVFAAIERHNHVWVNLDPHAAATQPPVLPPGLTLRSIFVRAPTAAVSTSLRQGYNMFGATNVPVMAQDEFTLSAATTVDGILHTSTFLLQPVAQQQTIIHALLDPEPPHDERLSILRHHNAQMSLARDTAESITGAPTNASVI